MALVAPASKSVRWKNIILIVAFAGFTVMFVYDGFWGYINRDDKLVEDMKGPYVSKIVADDRKPLAEWPGWHKATGEQREAMGKLAQRNNIDGWKSVLDIRLQQGLALGLVVATGWTLWRFVKCEKRRVRADEQGISPEPGVEIPWGSITQVDNRRWPDKGFVDITYTDATGKTATATLDDYIVERGPLIEILKEMEAKAAQAKFLNPEEDEGAKK